VVGPASLIVWHSNRDFRTELLGVLGTFVKGLSVGHVGSAPSLQ